MALLPLDGPSDQTSIVVTTSEVEAKVGASAFPERKIVTIQPLDGRVRVLFKTGLAATSGFLVFKNQIASFEASDTQPVYLRTESGSTTVIVSERS
jgi:hypothetical protein